MAKRTGILYIVTNDINEKVYIGKTYNTLNHRWQEHKKDSKKEDRHYKFYRAIRKYGIEHFEIKELGRFEEGLLEEKEIEYIEKYDSYRYGYNSTLGGEGTLRFNLTEKEQEDVINSYILGESIDLIASRYSCGISSISKFLHANNIDIRGKSESIKMVMYDKFFNIERIFDCKKDVLKWLEGTKYSVNSRTMYGFMKSAHETGCIRYGHHWQEYQSLILEDDGKEMLFRTSFEKEKYLEDKTVHIELKDGFYIIPGYLEEKFNLNVVKIEHTICPRCGKKKYYLSEICQDCRNELNEIRSKKKKQAKNILLKFKDISHLSIKYNRDIFKEKTINKIDILINGFLSLLDINSRYKEIKTLFHRNKSKLKIKYINNHKIIIDKHVHKVRRRTENIKKLCPLCNKNYVNIDSKMCIDCYNKKKSINIPPKEELEKHLSDGLSMVAISKIYGKTDNCIKKWLKKYDIYEPKNKKSTIDNKNYPCKIVKDEFEKEFKSISEASRWLIENKYSNVSLDNLNYSLKQIIDTNKRCGGFYIKSVKANEDN